MSRIKQRILALYTKRLTQTNRVVRTNVGFQQAQHVGILYSADNLQKHTAVDHLTRELQKMKKKVTVLCYATVPIQQVQQTDPTFAIITHRDLQPWGTITHPAAQIFVDTPFDYLFQVDLVGHAVINYLLAKSQAKCRIGYHDTMRENLFEMMVTFDEDPHSNNMDMLMTQMVHYAQLLTVR